MVDRQEGLMSLLKTLKQAEGRKLLWVGLDEKTDTIHCIFEGWIGVSVNEGFELQEPKQFAGRFLDEALIGAQAVLKLKGLIDAENKPKPAAPAPAPGGTPAQG